MAEAEVGGQAITDGHHSANSAVALRLKVITPDGSAVTPEANTFQLTGPDQATQIISVAVPGQGQAHHIVCHWAGLAP